MDELNKNIPSIREAEFVKTPEWKLLVSGPFIWAPLLPMLVLDLFVEIYHNICFPLYGLKPIKRRNYFFFDRKNLPELSWLDRINCHYCAYANGLAAYFVAIANETEAFWCAIKHKEKISFKTQPHTVEFKEQSTFE